MAYSAELSRQLYEELHRRGYDEGLCTIIAKQMCTEWTARRMLGYVRQAPHLKEEELVDEMLGILADRDRIIQKKEAEFYQSKVNELYWNGLDTEEE